MTPEEKCHICGLPISAPDDPCTHCGPGITAAPEVKHHIVNRTIAAGIDLGVFFLFSLGLVRAGLGWFAVPLSYLILLEVGYQLRGSLGKSLFGLSVKLAGRRQYYLREVVGKAASTAILGIGYLLIFSKDRLALHDLIAKTSVIPAKTLKPAMQWIRILPLLAAAGAAGYLLPRLSSVLGPDESKPPDVERPLDAITRQMTSVLTISCYDEKGERDSLGSGFLVTSDGAVVTDFHVIEGAFRAEAALGDGRLFEVIGVRAFDPTKDIAVLQLGRKFGDKIQTPSGLPFLELGSSKSVAAGDRIAIISSPEGLANTVSDGLVSAVRTTGTESYIQISAPISPGSSGSPVFNLSGKVIAVSDFQLKEGQNLNFAIPVEVVTEVRQAEDYLDFDKFRILSAMQVSSEMRPKQPESSGNIADDKSAHGAAINGVYTGVVENLTASVSSGFGIVAREEGGSINGCLGVLTPLYGSGTLEGSREGSNVEFEVKSAQFDLVFVGIVRGKEILGTYTASSTSGGDQSGKFHLEKQEKKMPDLSGGCPTDEEMNSDK